MALGRFYELFFCFCKGNKISAGIEPTLLNKINKPELLTLVIGREHRHRSTR